MIKIAPLDTPSPGDRSYLVTDGQVAVVIDPHRDLDRLPHRLVDEPPAVAALFPAPGFGSSCSSPQAEDGFGTASAAGLEVAA